MTHQEDYMQILHYFSTNNMIQIDFLISKLASTIIIYVAINYSQISGYYFDLNALTWKGILYILGVYSRQIAQTVERISLSSTKQ